MYSSLTMAKSKSHPSSHLDTLRHAVMYDKAHIWLVDPHAKRDGGADDDHLRKVPLEYRKGSGVVVLVVQGQCQWWRWWWWWWFLLPPPPTLFACHCC